MIHFLSVFFILQMKELRPRMMEMMRYLFQSHRSNKKKKKKARTQNSRILYPNSSTTTCHPHLGTSFPRDGVLPGGTLPTDRHQLQWLESGLHWPGVALSALSLRDQLLRRRLQYLLIFLYPGLPASYFS